MGGGEELFHRPLWTGAVEVGDANKRFFVVVVFFQDRAHHVSLELTM